MGCGYQANRGEMMSSMSRIFLPPAHQLHLHAQAPPGLWWLLSFQGITLGDYNVQKEKDTVFMCVSFLGGSLFQRSPRSLSLMSLRPELVTY